MHLPGVGPAPPVAGQVVGVSHHLQQGQLGVKSHPSLLDEGSAEGQNDPQHCSPPTHSSFPFCQPTLHYTLLYSLLSQGSVPRSQSRCWLAGESEHESALHQSVCSMARWGEAQKYFSFQTNKLISTHTDLQGAAAAAATSGANGCTAYQTTCRPKRSRSSKKSSMRVMNSRSAAKLPAMKDTKLASCVRAGEGNCCKYFSAALWLESNLHVEGVTD